jgi:pilus assembly protein CpaE
VPIAVQIPSSRSVPASINRGVPIVLDEPGHPVSVAIRNFAEKEIAAGAPVKPLPASMRTDNRRFGLRRRTEKST